MIGSKSKDCLNNGQCPCKTGYAGVKCNRCEYNFYRSSPDKECTGIWYVDYYSRVLLFLEL